MTTLRRIFELSASLKLTLACLTAAILLIFTGTIAQVHLGIHEAQQRYFQSLFVWWPPQGNGFRIPVFPGGHLIGAVLLVNLLAAHASRFAWAWRKLGIHLTHIGLIIMLAAGLFTDLFAVESQMRLSPGETKAYSEDGRRVELALIDQTDPATDQMTVIPQELLRREGTITHPSLPFAVVVRKFYQNSQLHLLSDGTGGMAAVTRGLGRRILVEPLARATRVNQRDFASAVLEIRSAGAETASLGTWLVSDALGTPQGFSYGGRSWRLALRPVRYYQPFSVTLQKFSHDLYPGTEIPKNFSSQVTIHDPDRAVQRDVLIYMNHPLRYRGQTFYQAGFERGDTATVLQVVHNPSFLAPYLACLIVALGLLIQFGYHLVGFSRRRMALP
jgi:hypothetical protein